MGFGCCSVYFGLPSSIERLSPSVTSSTGWEEVEQVQVVGEICMQETQSSRKPISPCFLNERKKNTDQYLLNLMSDLEVPSDICPVSQISKQLLLECEVSLCFPANSHGSASYLNSVTESPQGWRDFSNSAKNAVSKYHYSEPAYHLHVAKPVRVLSHPITITHIWQSAMPGKLSSIYGIQRDNQQLGSPNALLISISIEPSMFLPPLLQ